MIVAAAKNRVIGLNNKMPWHISGDLKYFKAQTMGKPIVMGRNTFESMGKPLPGRTSIVITRNKNYQVPKDVVVVTSLGDAIKSATNIAKKDGVDEIMIIGGAQIYKLAIPISDRLYITEIETTPNGDAHFPEFDKSNWQEISRVVVEASSNDESNYAFVVWDRK